MSEQRPRNVSVRLTKEDITDITVGGFKSISQQQSIEIRPLTLLAGANSSGKSSMMQALLLLKQTLEATYDPGALLLNGPNVKFTLADQLLSRKSNGRPVDTFQVGIRISTGSALTTYFKQSKNKGFDVQETRYDAGESSFRLAIGMSQDEIQAAYAKAYRKIPIGNVPTIVQNRCFLKLNVRQNEEDSLMPVRLIRYETYLENVTQQIIHLPGLRGSPERDYPATAVGPSFPGTFEPYVASIIEQWQLDNDTKKLEKLYYHLAQLSLTKKVVARRKNDTAIELLVNRYLYEGKEDMVSIADVGLGVSQALPESKPSACWRN